MQPSFYSIPVQANGQLFLMPKPSGEWLSDDLGKLQRSGVGLVVSMLTPDESSALGLTGEEACCDQLGLEFLALPVADRTVPDLRAVQTLVSLIVQRLREGKGVAVHCRAGIGRSGLVVCCVLIALGARPEDAVGIVSDARGVPVPDTWDQRAFIMSYPT